MKTLKSVILGDVVVDVLGTAHVSADSVEEVRTVLENKQYDLIAVELCDKRFGSIFERKMFMEQDLYKVIKSRQFLSSALILALSGYQQNISKDLNVELGGEFIAAVKYAQKHNLPVALIDRRIDITFKRLYRRLSWWKKLLISSTFLGNFLHREKITKEQVESLKMGDPIEGIMREVPFDISDLIEVIIKERDDYMALKLLSEIRKKGAKSILCVVGMGHQPGLCEKIQQYAIQNAPVSRIQAYEKTPSPSRFWKYAPWLLVAAIMSGFFLGFTQDSQIGWKMVEYWVLANGLLAALGGIIAFAHPLTILSVFFAAPITSLNPTIGVGLVAILVELYFRKPKMADFDTLKDDITSLKGWRRNRVARSFLTSVLTTVGSIIGTYLGGFYIFSSLS